MSPQKLRAGLFGAGEMATIHVMNLINDPRIDLACIVDPSADRTEALAAATGAAVTDPATAFADPTLDIYVIASPPRTHADYLERAVKTRAYILCEKPMDHDKGGVRTCMAALRARESFVQIGFNRRFDAQFCALKAAITAGLIGRPEQVLIISCDAEAPEVEGFIHSSGMLQETAIHDFDLIRWLLEDEPTEIFVMADALINPDYLTVGHIDTTTCAIRMAGGTHVTVLNSLRAAYGYDQRIEALGTLGQASVGNAPQSLLVLATADGIRGEKPLRNYHQRYADAYRTEILQFIIAFARGLPVSPNATDGVRASEIAEAAILSMTAKGPIAL